MIVGVLLVALAAAAPPGAETPFRGALYGSALGDGADPAAPLRGVSLPAAERARLDGYLARWKAFRSTPPASVSRRRVIQRGIVALFDRPDAETWAAGFVEKAVAASQTPANSEGPWNEATAAEGLLREAPEGPFAPYLFVYLADRYRAAYELAGKEANPQRQKQAARKYRTFLTRARSTSDPLLTGLADDLDGRKFLAYDTGVHPGTFNPDG